MHLYTFMSGGIMACSLVIALFFLRFWRRTGDRFFMLFAMAFFVLAFNRVGIVLSGEPQEARATVFYVIRLSAFVLVLIAILDKNWPRRSAAAT